MATPKELLAASLDVLHRTERDGVVRSSEISRTHRERLKRNGFLEEVTKGWLIVTNPAILKGSSTSWYVSFWPFVRRYLNERFGDGYCLSPEASIKIHTGSTLVPKQLIVITKKKGVQTLSLPLGTSLLMYMVIRLTAVTPICCMVVLMLSLTDILSFYGSNTYSLIDKTVEQ